MSEAYKDFDWLHFSERIISNLCIESVFFQWLHEQIFVLKNRLRIFNDTSKFEAMSFYMALTLYTFPFGFSIIVNWFSLHLLISILFTSFWSKWIDDPVAKTKLEYLSSFMSLVGDVLHG